MYLSSEIAKLHVECLCSQLKMFISVSGDADGKDGVETAREMLSEMLSGDLDRTEAAIACLYEMLTGPRGGIRSFFDSPTTSYFDQEPENVDNIPSL